MAWFRRAARPLSRPEIVETLTGHFRLYWGLDETELAWAKLYLEHIAGERYGPA